MDTPAPGAHTAIGAHRGTYDAVFQHPIARNLQWHDVRSMLTALANVTEESGGGLKFTRNGHTLTVQPPRRKDFSDVQELMRIRQFLQQSGEPPRKPAAEGLHLLVVLDHREARVFRAELHGSVPQRITPHEPHGPSRHLHNVGNDSNGQRTPEPKAFYDAIARTLERAQSILILGSSTGSSSAMDHLAAELKQHHPEIARRIAGTVVVNEQHMSEDQLLAEARAFYAASRPK
ncbi:MAG: hypothetical protein JWN24_3371 [Phycisphaerales bacterium]|nr:hypothetical protein [Phycisphaerales bacterium]